MEKSAASSENSKNLQNDLTSGGIFKNLVRFSLPFLLSCFLQTFYGLADLFITGQFNGPSTISAVSIGSQLMHMITVIIVGLAMGATVCIGRAVGMKDRALIKKNIGTSVTFFLFSSIIMSIILIFCAQFFLRLLSTPAEAFPEAKNYCVICFAGIPFITAYNILSSIYRGLGDSKSPMIFIFIAGVLNIALDYAFIGGLGMGAGGAALATVISQALSALIGAIMIRSLSRKSGILQADASGAPNRLSFPPDKTTLSHILRIGVPVACQDGLIQVSFLVITAIANSRGVLVAASVGIVEKIICFLFLVPSAMLSSVSAIAAQNAGAGKHERGIKTLSYAISICVIFGIIVTVIGWIFPSQIMSLFSKDSHVVELGGQYFRTYVTDCIVAGVHFCFSGFFCAYGKSMYSFIHNILSISLIRIPGTYLAAKFFPETLAPMGMAAPIGSLFSAILCTILFFVVRKKIIKNI